MRSKLGKKKSPDVLVQVITNHIAAKTNTALPVSISPPLSFLSRESLLHTLHMCILAYFNLCREQVPHEGYQGKTVRQDVSTLLFLKLYLDYLLSLDLLK